MAGRLQGKVALVTGGGAGIGEAIARRFHDEGAQVVVNDLDDASAERVAKAVGGRALVADVADSAAVREMFADVAAREGRLDVLVNNAGISGQEGNPDVAEDFVRIGLAQAEEVSAGGPIRTHWDATLNCSDEAWQRMIAVHLHGTFYCCREGLRIMGAQGNGAIVNLGSIMGTAGGAGAPAYSAAKAGILGYTRALARDVVTRGIRVNAIAPGFIESNMTVPFAALRPMLEMQTPMGRYGEPDDIAWAAVYLASDEAKFVTGQVLSPNGGWHMSQ